MTEQVRGFAILLVVIGHVGFHTLALPNEFIVLGEFGVSIFFFLSGFGLTYSYYRKELVVREFIKRRITRVMIPYWIATVIILFLDNVVLGRQYNTTTICLTVFGINVTESARQIDYVRWYITLLLFWYIIFTFCWKILSKKYTIWVLMGIGFIGVVVNYYLVDIGYAFMPFPFGAWVASLSVRDQSALERFRDKRWRAGSILVMLLCVLLTETTFEKIAQYVPYISIVFAREGVWVLFTMSTLILFISFGQYMSQVLKIFGKYSYEIFLLHGNLMIKYDLLLFRLPLFISFWLYLLLLLLFSALMKRQGFDRVQKWFPA